jgi:enterochelin esterase-like enzyme
MGPQSPLLFFVLLVIFGALLYTVARTKKIVWKAVAGTAAFAPPMIFGVATINRYYDYYTSWDDVWQDLSDSYPGQKISISDFDSAGTLNDSLKQIAHQPHTARMGVLFSARLPGRSSGISRNALVYLPPQYFQAGYARLRFPVLELLHGSPGQPTDYLRLMRITDVYRSLLGSGRAKPAVLLMPDSNGGRDIALQCLDTVRGPSDETYLAADVPADISGRLRVQPPGPGWGVAGYSEGGFCAANLAIRHPYQYGVAGVMSGYFEPLPYNRLPRRVDPFAGKRSLRAANTPSLKIRTLSSSTKLPAFWVMTGSGSRRDLQGTQIFVNLLHRFQPDLNPVIVPGGRHDFQSWRKALPQLLSWMTPRLRPPQP